MHRLPNDAGEKMKIAMLGSFPPLRGISSYCSALSTAMAGAHCEVHFFSFKKMYPKFLYPGKNLEDDPTSLCLPRPFLKVSRTLSWYNPISWVMAGIKSHASVFHAQWWALPLAPIYLCICFLFKCRNIPVVLTLHNITPHESSRIFYGVSRLLFAMGDHFIVHCMQNKMKLTKIYGIPEKAISIIPHGLLAFETPSTTNRTQLRKALGFRPEDQVMLVFGTIRPYKGIDTAIRALSRVVQDLPEARLLIAGKLWQDWTPYQEKISRYGLESRITCVFEYIPADQVYRYFHACDLVLLPYQHFDSQSGVGSAAVFFRKPLIVTRTGGLPDLVLDPDAVVPPTDEDALAKAILHCFKTPFKLRKLTQDADIMARQLSWPHIAERTVSLYRHVSQKNRRARKTDFPHPVKGSGCDT
ncbi:glycosyltransferase [Desulfosarcina sp. OttesenSCG-928-A07]|nr:glycosyltransferase [Desulfosarcina sp. OttesenSCG-928-A07]